MGGEHRVVGLVVVDGEGAVGAPGGVVHGCRRRHRWRARNGRVRVIGKSSASSGSRSRSSTTTASAPRSVVAAATDAAGHLGGSDPRGACRPAPRTRRPSAAAPACSMHARRQPGSRPRPRIDANPRAGDRSASPGWRRRSSARGAAVRWPPARRPSPESGRGDQGEVGMGGAGRRPSTASGSKARDVDLPW